MRSLPLQPVSPAIRGLNLTSLARQIEAYGSGYLSEFARTAQAMEDRDELLKNVISKRKKAVSGLEWEIVPCDDTAEARTHTQALIHFYENLTCSHALKENQQGGLSLLVYQMMDALAKGWAVHEITWEILKRPDGRKRGAKPLRQQAAKAMPGPDHGMPFQLTAVLRFIPLWYFEHRTGRLRFSVNGPFREGEELKEREWLVTTAEPLMLACARAFLFKQVPLQSWLDYCQKSGAPVLKGVTAAARNTPEWNEMARALDQLVKDLTVVTNNSESIEVLDLKGRGDAPYEALVDRMDRMMAALWRGADLSTISRDNGYGASLQEEESTILRAEDAELISTTLNCSLDRWVVQILFGERTVPKACIKLLVPQREQTQYDLAVDQFLIAHGARLSLPDALTRYGRAEAREGERSLSFAKSQENHSI